MRWMVDWQWFPYLKQTGIVYRDNRSTPNFGLKRLGVYHYALFVSIEGGEILPAIFQCYFYLFHVHYA